MLFKCLMILHTEILSKETSDYLKQFFSSRLFLCSKSNDQEQWYMYDMCLASKHDRTFTFH